MAVTEQTVYGYLMDELGVLNDPMDVSLKSDSNGQEVHTLTGNGSIANGTVVQTLSVKNATPRESVERERIYNLHLQQKYVTFRYRLDNEQYEIRGKITSCSFSSATQKANTFDFDFKGFPQ